jgi:nucleoside-diphosphate-sugar epimerase
MKILVTGSSGMVGTHLCERLLREGHDVVGVDWKPNEWNKEVDALTLVVDLRDKANVLRVLPEDPDVIVHLAANARVHDLVVDPSLARDNFEILFNVLEYGRASSIKRFMFSSSREVYGNTGRTIHSEDEALSKNCESPYTASKIGGEALVHSYQQCYGIDFCIFRYSNVYGMYDRSNRIVPLFIKRCSANEELTVFGGDKLLDFTYITDAVDGTILLLNKFDSVKNEVYNLASGKGTPLLELAELIKSETNSNSQIQVEPSRIGEVVKYIADISKIKAAIEYVPKVSVQEGIKRALEWYRNIAM